MEMLVVSVLEVLRVSVGSSVCHCRKTYRVEMLVPVLQSVARRLGQGEMYDAINPETDILVMPKGASEIEVRAKQVGCLCFSFLFVLVTFLHEDFFDYPALSHQFLSLLVLSNCPEVTLCG